MGKRNNFSKKNLYRGSVLIGLLALSVYAYTGIPNPGHGGDSVVIFINGSQRMLQEAIDSGQFSMRNITGGMPTNIPFGHNGDEIIVNINNSYKSLQAAINDSSLTSQSLPGLSPQILVVSSMVTQLLL